MEFERERVRGIYDGGKMLTEFWWVNMKDSTTWKMSA
jgi:hypothetical protein